MCGGDWCGGGCGAPNCFGNLMYMFEKLAACCAMTAVTSCIVITVLLSIGLGVGIGYNYSFVDQKTHLLEGDDKYKSKALDGSGSRLESLMVDRLPEHTTQWSTTPTYKPGWTRLRAEHESGNPADTPDIPQMKSGARTLSNFGPPKIPTFLGPQKIPTDEKSSRTRGKLGPPKNPETKDDKETGFVDYDDITAKKQVDMSNHDYDGIDDATTEKAVNVLITEDPQRRKAKYKSRRLPEARRKYNKIKQFNSSPMPTLLIPLLQGSQNLSPLISKILSQKKNVTLQFITI